MHNDRITSLVALIWLSACSSTNLDGIGPDGAVIPSTDTSISDGSEVASGDVVAEMDIAREAPVAEDSTVSVSDMDVYRADSTDTETVPCIPGAECSDEDPCTAEDRCILDTSGDYLCQGNPIDIDDGNPCTEDSCDQGNAVHTALNTGPCDVDDLCSTSGSCIGGQCVPDTPCECYLDSDCPQPDDLCAGIAFCDTTSTTPICAIIPESIIDCEPPDNVCQQAACNPENGLCETLLAPDGTLCNDNNACTDADSCTAGNCTGTSVECDDGTFCNGNETCDALNGCIPGTAPSIDDGIPCTLDSCNEDTDTISNQPKDTLCDDGTFCNGNETCDALNGCIPGTAPSIDDGIPCTLDSCNEDTDTISNQPNDTLCPSTGICKTGFCDLNFGCLSVIVENCCGNGLKDGEEDCDTGGISISCDSDCTWAECGDGTVNSLAGEICDEQGASAFCDNDCTLPECGDGVINSDAGESCDGGDTCNDDCTIIPSLSVVAVEPIAYEGGTTAGTLQVSVAAPLPESLTVPFTLSGSAEPGSDYVLTSSDSVLQNTITIPAGHASVDIAVTPVATPEMERTESMTLTLTAENDTLIAPETASASVSLMEFGPSPGAVYHVSPAGDDTANGSLNTPFKTLTYAVSMLEAGDTLFIHDGTYTNPGFTEDHGVDGTKDNNNGVVMQIGLSGSADTWTRIAAYPDGNDIRPVLRFDGAGGIQIKPGASHLRIEGLEIEGPNRTILHDWAHTHRWSKEALYNGRGIFTWGPADHIVIRDCNVHHTPNSGIRFNKADYILVENNTVSNATWWSSSAESGIVIATALNIDNLDVVKILYSGNVVYNNWNFMEFCDGPLEDSTDDLYGNCDNYTGGIIDGQGLYVTRNLDTYQHGRMRFENNIAFNNGFGGVTYHKTNNGELVNNLVFMNGAYPGTSKYTGLTLNTANDVLIQNNIVWARDLGNYAIKNNGNTSNIAARNNYVVGKSQFGSASENTIIEMTNAPPFGEFFTNVTGIASIVPHPDATSGPASAKEIDNVLTALAMDFRPLPTTWQVIDAGTPTEAPPVDIDGTPRQSNSATDIGPYAIEGTLHCADNGLATGSPCDDGLLSTANDTCAASGACFGEPFGCYAYPCHASSTPNGNNCDTLYHPPGVPCDDEVETTLVDTCDGNGQCLGVSPTALVLHADFEQQSLGVYEQSMVQDDFGTDISWNNGLNEGRVIVEQEPGNRFLRVSYPLGEVGPGAGGAQFKVALNMSAEELYISYRVRFRNGFDFVKGGKLPGLCGGDCNTGGDVPNGADGFSARLMWRTDGKVVQYMYVPEQVSQWGDNLYWDASGQTSFAPGQWHYVRTRIVMNTPGLNDGMLQSWFDGVLALDRNDMRYRDVASLSIDTLYFSTFFGGSGGDWAPTDNEYADFYDFIITPQWPVP